MNAAVLTGTVAAAVGWSGRYGLTGPVGCPGPGRWSVPWREGHGPSHAVPSRRRRSGSPISGAVGLAGEGPILKMGLPVWSAIGPCGPCLPGSGKADRAGRNSVGPVNGRQVEVCSRYLIAVAAAGP